MPSPTTNPIDMIHIANRLKMPIAIYEALKLLLNASTPHYEDAIKYLETVKFEISNGDLSLPLQSQANTLFISEIKRTVITHTQAQINTTHSQIKTNLFMSVCLAINSLIDLFASDKQSIPAIHLFNDALDHLQAAVFWQSALNTQAANHEQA